jgi:hypothetical protein
MGSQAELGNNEEAELGNHESSRKTGRMCLTEALSHEGLHEPPSSPSPLVALVPKLRLGMRVEKLCFLPYLPYQSVTTLISPSCPA